MEEPQQPQEADGSFQCMDLGWELLLKITRHMDTAGRSSWRLVSKAARQAVYDSTTALAPCKGGNPSRPRVKDSTTALLPQLLAKCGGLKQLSCRDLPHLYSIIGLLQLPLCLEALDISHTDVDDLSFILPCTSLRRLETAFVPGCEGLEGSRQLAAVLQQLPGLTALKLFGNKLCVDAARDIAAALQNLTGLEELDIGRTGQEAAAEILPALPCPERLRLLDLSYCLRVGLALPAALPATLRLTRQLQQLDLSGNNLGADDAAALAPALRRLSQLKGLNLGDNKVGDEGASALAPAIQQLTGLTSLKLSRNLFGLAGVRALAPALRHLTRLQHLDLAGNDMQHLGPEGAALLAPVVQELPGLLLLNLSHMSLRNQGAAALAPALRRLTLLQHLHLGYNDLGPNGVQALLPGIQRLVSLRSLGLRGNTLGRSALLFAAGMRQLTRLEELELCGHLLDEEVEQALADIIHTASPGCKVSFLRGP